MTLFKKCYDFQDADMVKAVGLYPLFRPMEGSLGAQVLYNGKCVVMIGSNNYLGLTHDSRIKQAAKEAVDRFGSGFTGSRALNGTSVMHNELETAFADYLEKESTLVMTTGFITNLGSISCLVEEGEYILSDSENHASIVAGCKAAKGKVVVYQHNDMKDLEEKLAALPKEAGKLIVTDGVFSMTGEIANLPEIVAIKKKSPNTFLYVDDAHGMGVLGRNGRGTPDHFGLTEDVDLIMGTFSKSFASVGGVIAGADKVIDYIRHKSRAFIFSASLPPAAVGSVLKALEIVQKEPEIFERLWENVRYIKQGFENLNLSYIESQTPIISIFVGDEGKTFQLIKELFERNIFATPVIFPAVPYGQAMIRTSYMATHTKEDLDCVLEVMKTLAPKYGIVRGKTEVPTELTNRDQRWNFDSILQTGEAS